MWNKSSMTGQGMVLRIRVCMERRKSCTQRVVSTYLMDLLVSRPERTQLLKAEYFDYLYHNLFQKKKKTLKSVESDEIQILVWDSKFTSYFLSYLFLFFEDFSYLFI